jgi:hypothetical protein
MPAYFSPPEAIITNVVVEMATAAVQTAYQETRDEGLTVLVAVDDSLVQITPDDDQIVLKSLPPLQTPARRMLIIR